MKAPRPVAGVLPLVVELVQVTDIPVGVVATACVLVAVITVLAGVRLSSLSLVLAAAGRPALSATVAPARAANVPRSLARMWSRRMVMPRTCIS